MASSPSVFLASAIQRISKIMLGPLVYVLPLYLREIYPNDVATLEKIGHGIAGSPATVRDHMSRLQSETGVNTVLCQMVFGDISVGDAERSIRLFGGEVIPAFA